MRYIVPLILFLIISIFLWKGLEQDPHKLPSALIGKPVPEFNYPTLEMKQYFTNKEFLGHISLLNVWATWCITCSADHRALM